MLKPIKKSKQKYILIILIILVIIIFCHYSFHNRINVKGKIILCIPVYGQSLALGEEASRITDISRFSKDNQERVVTENLDGQFGFFDNNSFKQSLKKLLHYQKRSFELSVYGMSASLVQQLDSDTIICTFPGGQGATTLAHLSKGSQPYQQFLSNIKKAFLLAQKGHCTRFYVPAICWMQGESDIADYPDTDYQQLLLQFKDDINNDVKAITHQSEDVRLICYQPNALTRAPQFKQDAYHLQESQVPQTFVNLLRKDTLFWASGPTYPYAVVREVVHIDGVGQQHIGHLAATSAMGILRHQPRFLGLLPLSTHVSDSNVIIRFNVPCPPLVLDTFLVRRADLYGFQVITPSNKNIAEQILVDSLNVTIRCMASPVGCRVRYAVNGDYMKSGNRHGPRGNLRDSQGEKIKFNIQGKSYPLHNWAYQFDEYIEK